MAWFNPPLCKPGNKRCPSCGQTQWDHVLNNWFYSKWHCSRCQSVLRLDVRRKLMGSLACAAGYSAILFPILLMRPLAPAWTLFPAIIAFVGMAVLTVWWFESVNLKSTSGQPQSHSSSGAS